METWHHACGYPIFVSSLEKQGSVVRVFLDSDPLAQQRAIAECPGCDRRLHLSTLVPESEYDDMNGENEAAER